MPVNLGAAQIAMDASVLTPPPNPDTQTLTNGDSTLALPAGINAIFNLYTGADDSQTLMGTWNLTEERNILRLPTGFKAFDWQFEIVTRCPVKSIEVASTMKELGGV
jgi:hypothetical protein